MNCAPTDWLQSRPQLYAGPLANGDVAAVIVNWSGSDYTQRFEFLASDVFGGQDDVGSVVVRDMWKRQDVGVVEKGQKISVESIPGYGNYAFRIRRQESKPSITV